MMRTCDSSDKSLIFSTVNIYKFGTNNREQRLSWQLLIQNNLKILGKQLIAISNMHPKLTNQGTERLKDLLLAMAEPVAEAGVEPVSITHVLVLLSTTGLTSIFNGKELLWEHLYLHYLPENITPMYHMVRAKT